jgi:anti-sigma factor RsiW
MIENEKQLRLQSFLDGELPETEANEVARWVAQDQEASALLTELRQTHQALGGFEEGIKLPESREFYWSKIQREIARAESPRSAPAPNASWAARFRRFLMPATGLAVVALLALIVTREGGGLGDANVETALEDSGAFTYHDFSAGATLVWLSYPAEKEAIDNDDLDSLD